MNSIWTCDSCFNGKHVRNTTPESLHSHFNVLRPCVFEEHHHFEMKIEKQLAAPFLRSTHGRKLGVHPDCPNYIWAIIFGEFSVRPQTFVSMCFYRHIHIVTLIRQGSVSSLVPSRLPSLLSSYKPESLLCISVPSWPLWGDIKARI